MYIHTVPLLKKKGKKKKKKKALIGGVLHYTPALWERCVLFA